MEVDLVPDFGGEEGEEETGPLRAWYWGKGF